MTFFNQDDKTKTSVIITVAILLILAGGSIFYFYTQSKSFLVKENYQAVFLSNDQVYFGKITENKDDWIVLENIYYLQFSKPLQGQKKGEEITKSDVTLNKLGNEIHGPRDMMKINREQILFIEELTGESKVISAIRDHQGG
ncbi:MAG: hypothetical protein ABEJ24_01080 [Candidatus Magasanikbacteria bacterium]